jgi:tRNA pseudouridine55 synthase
VVRVISPHGVLVADKPTGPTSHDVVQQARRLYGTRNVGHAGTLDPLATGVLLLLFGEGLKLSPYLSAEQKRYRARVSFGRATDTLDALGRTTKSTELDPDWLTLDALERALDGERRRTAQLPPEFSAIRLSGKRAHRLSRRGEAPRLTPRAVHVRALDIVEPAANFDSVEFELTVSKGYYVRAFARDLGDALGVPAHLASLRRLSSGAFTLDDAVVWPPDAPRPLIALELAAARALPMVRLTPSGERRARFGQALGIEDFSEDPLPAHGPFDEHRVVAWAGTTGLLVALGRRDTERGFRVLRGFGDCSASFP